MSEYISSVNHDSGLYNKLHTSIHRFQRHSEATQPTPASAPQSSPSTPQPSTWALRATRLRDLPHSGDRLELDLPPLRPEEVLAYDPETVLVGTKLLMDMEKAGIHLPEGRRARMQELMNLNQHFGMTFNTNLVRFTQCESPHRRLKHLLISEILAGLKESHGHEA